MAGGGPGDGLTANQCHGYASRSDGSLAQRRGKCPLPRCWLRATKDQFAGFLRWSAPAPRAATPPQRRAHREMRVASCPTPGSGEGIVMTKTSSLEGGWNGPRVQVIAPHDQCLRWVMNGPDALEMRCPRLSRKQTSIGRRRKVGFLDLIPKSLRTNQAHRS